MKNKWNEYERRKKIIIQQANNSGEYESMIMALAKELRI